MMTALLDVSAVAKAEFLLGIRNRWAILAIVLFLVFASVLSFVGGAPGDTGHISRLTLSVASLSALSIYLTPLLALLLSFDSVAGEIDRGALPLLVATPASRASIIMGKFFGHLAVLAVAIVIGFGAPGLIIDTISPGGNLADLLRLIATSIFLGAGFLAIGYNVSALARTSALAAGLAVGVWLILVALYDLALLGGLVADAGGDFSRNVFPWLLIANPADAFRLYNLAALDVGGFATGLSGDGRALPFPPSMALFSLAMWVVFALAGAVATFARLKP